MLADVDSYIQTRLQQILLNGVSVPVYGYIPDRDKGHTDFPCLALLRHDIMVREADKKPDNGIMTPSTTNVTVTATPDNRHRRLTGPESFTIKPYPTPVDVLYEVVACSTNSNDNNFLTEMFFQAFPPGHMAYIGDCCPLFVHGKPIVKDHLDLPEYQISFLLTVTDLWIDRFEIATVPSITVIEQTSGSMSIENPSRNLL
jgi:hypothetical protein